MYSVFVEIEIEASFLGVGRKKIVLKLEYYECSKTVVIYRRNESLV